MLRTLLVVAAYALVVAVVGAAYYRYRLRRAELRHERVMAREAHSREVLDHELERERERQSRDDRSDRDGK
jgi:Flp pilus assembly protein TadB